MSDRNVLAYIEKVVKNMPSDWLKLTTHRLDIYDEELAKTEFIQEFDKLYQSNQADSLTLGQLPTAYDYIRLGHPLSSVLEWTVAKLNDLGSEHVISFSSFTMPIMGILRKNSLEAKNTLLAYTGSLPSFFDADLIRTTYGYKLDIIQLNNIDELAEYNGSIVYFSEDAKLDRSIPSDAIDFCLNYHTDLGSILMVNGEKNKDYISAIQHVRRRESIAMTPQNCHFALENILGKNNSFTTSSKDSLASVRETIKSITASETPALIGSSGLSIQYSIMMGLIDYAQANYPDKSIKIIVPPNCYGGTNDQARRVAAALPRVDILDLLVDGDNDMVQSTDQVLAQVAAEDAVPLIIAEIPTNPRVEVPNLKALQEALSRKRQTSKGNTAIAPVFILDQTFCPNVQFLSPDGILSSIPSISYVSGSKFPSGGKCTAGYCVANNEASHLMKHVETHLELCDNVATSLQLSILAEQMPSMLQRIKDAYNNTYDFVNFIKTSLPEAKINFVSEALADEGFTPSVFSLDLPTKGGSPEEKEKHKRELNQKLIHMMITEIPNESKYCVSYGQLKGCYWTIPATSTQGTTKESDKDYIARVSVSPDLDLAEHKKVFQDFVDSI